MPRLAVGHFDLHQTAFEFCTSIALSLDKDLINFSLAHVSISSKFDLPQQCRAGGELEK
jgi:hypothetical protein